MRSNLTNIASNTWVKSGAAVATSSLLYQLIPQRYQSDFNELLSRYFCSTGLLMSTQPVSVPVLNLLVAKLNGETYTNALFKRLLNNPSDLYQSAFQNTSRRIFGVIPSSVFADFLTNKYGYDKYITAIFATIIETSLSLSLGEIKEKQQIVKTAAESYGGFYSEKGFQKNRGNGSIVIGLASRNSLFMAAIFSVEPLSEFISESTNSSLHKNQIAGALRYAFTVASVVPENITNNLVMGRSVKDIISNKEILQSLTRGALARGIYGALSSWSISTGLHIAKKIRENDNFELQDFFEAIKDQLDVLLLKPKSSPIEHKMQSDQISVFLDRLSSEATQFTLDYDELAVEKSREALKIVTDSFSKVQNPETVDERKNFKYTEAVAKKVDNREHTR